MDELAIESLTSFQTLVKKRSRMVWSLSCILLLVLAGNIFLMSSGSDLGALAISENSPVTVVLIYSVFVIVFGALNCLFYVWWANKYLDPLIQEVNRDIANMEPS